MSLTYEPSSEPLHISAKTGVSILLGDFGSRVSGLGEVQGLVFEVYAGFRV